MDRGTTIAIPTILFLIFLVLKLTNNIAWSWWYITAPLWIPAVGGILFLLILFVVWLILRRT